MYAILFSRFAKKQVVNAFDAVITRTFENGQLEQAIYQAKNAEFDLPQLTESKTRYLCVEINSFSSTQHASYTSIKTENIILSIQIFSFLLFLIFISISIHFLFKLFSKKKTNQNTF